MCIEVSGLQQMETDETIGVIDHLLASRHVTEIESPGRLGTEDTICGEGICPRGV